MSLNPANTRHLYNICTTSAQRLRCWSNIVQMLYKCFVFTRLTKIVLLKIMMGGGGGEKLRQRQRRRANIVTTVGQCIVFTVHIILPELKKCCLNAILMLALAQLQN